MADPNEDFRQVRPPRRSASHGSLRSSSQTQSRPARSPIQLSGRPLRSLTEDPSFLPSPGPLESMLKTTTETGEIGAFTIKPKPTSKALHALSRSMSTHSDTGRSAGGSALAYSDRRQDGGSSRDTGIWSRRDAASEIISMYGSDSQGPQNRSYSSVSSPPIDEQGRSRSRTGWGRQPSNNPPSTTLKSPTTALQDISAGGKLQRPRSPFPYPTRLARPGVRPASPAMTEDGAIDYSRMVEIARVSHRTTHGSYWSASASIRGRSMSFQTVRNRPTPSLAPPRTANTPMLPPADYHSSSALPWRGGARGERGHGGRPAAPGGRSNSLSSIVDLYNRPASQGRAAPQAHSVGPFYYDYSEEFEDKSKENGPVQSRFPSARAPNNPMPHTTETGGFQPSSDAQMSEFEDYMYSDVFEEDVETSSDAGRSRSDGYDARGRLQFQQLGFPPGLRRGAEEVQRFGRQPNRLPGRERVHAGWDGRMLGSPFRSEYRGERPGARERDIPRRSLSNLSRTSNRAATDAGSMHERDQARRANSFNSRRTSTGSLGGFLRGKFRQSPDPEPSEANALDASIEVLAVTPFDSTNSGGGFGMGASSTPIEDAEASEPRACDSGQDGPRRKVPGKGDEANKLFVPGHRRAPATLKIDTGCTFPGYSDAQMSSHADTPILSPEPISPARQLRVRNSIPQLMQSLPALPSSVRNRANAMVEDETSQWREQGGPELGGEGSLSRESLDTVDTPDLLRAPISGRELRVPRLRLRAQNSWSQDLHRGFAAAGNGPGSATVRRSQSSASQRPRLRLRGSRSRFFEEDGDRGTVRRNPELKQHHSLADLGIHYNNDLFSQTQRLVEEDQPKVSGEQAVEEAEQATEAEKPKKPMISIPDTGAAGPEAQRENGDSSEVASPSRARRLRRKFSNWRIRGRPKADRQVEQTQQAQQAQRAQPAGEDQSATAALQRVGNRPKKLVDDPAPLPTGNTNSESVSSDHQHQPGRLRRWAREARHAVSSCVRRAANRSSQGPVRGARRESRGVGVVDDTCDI